MNFRRMCQLQFPMLPKSAVQYIREGMGNSVCLQNEYYRGNIEKVFGISWTINSGKLGDIISLSVNKKQKARKLPTNEMPIAKTRFH